ncbi:MAG TPA: FG-GAP-like repeat-containing protein [Candidatus Omnitrophota bacterium]|nr:FG-GAP-like repeat-containing protein [Candidatus Omnitrophota bacterium]
MPAPHAPSAGRFAVLAALAAVLLAAPNARAQYMYLDSNGDGVHTAADVLPATGTATVDVWLSSDRNRDGSLAVCSTGSQPFDIFSYEITLRATDGRVAFSGFVNHATLPTTLFAGGSTTEFYAAQFGIIAMPAGLHRLASVSVAVTSGTPSLAIVTDAPTLDHVAPQPTETAFGSHCGGAGFDNTIILGRDWFDVDGLLPGAPSTGGAPSLDPIADMTVDVGDAAAQALHATDPDGDPIGFTLESGPDFADVTTEDAGRGIAAGTLHAVPHADDTGLHAVVVAAGDGTLTARGSLQIHVNQGPNHPPIASIPSRITMVAGTVWRRTLVLRDLDGRSLSIQKASGPDFLSAGVVGQGEGGAVSFLRLGPSLCDAGEYDATLTVSAGATTETRSVHVSVRPAMAAPPSDLLVLPTHLYPSGLAGGDLNGDGLMDLVVVNEVRTLSVFVSLGGGAFAPEHSYPLGVFPAAPTSAALADFDEDGHLDAAVGLTGAIMVFRGRGDGSFDPPSTLPAKALPMDVIAVDLNDDGHVDVAVADGGTSAVSLFLGRGDGTFAPRKDVPVPGTPYGLISGDWNRDGRVDLAVAGAFYSTVSILLGHGDGTFHDPTSVTAGKSPFSVATGDWNNDGKLDLAIADFNGSLFIDRGDGNGGFVQTDEFDGFTAPQTVTAGDLNGDGIDDLVLADGQGFKAQVYRGDGAGAFVAAETIALPGGAHHCAIGDVDGDAVPDLAMTDQRYGAALVQRFASPQNAAGFARAFVTGDHRPVIIASRTPAFAVQVEPVEGSFAVQDVDLESLRLVSEGTGSVSSIGGILAKGAAAGDRDHNGVLDLSLWFAGEDLARLFDRITGRRDVPVLFEGRLLSGRPFCTRLVLSVQGPGAPMTASVAPNPLNPNGVLRFVTTVRGPLHVALFDIQGRRVRTLVETEDAPAGAQRIAIDGRTDAGSALASGIYFFRIEAAEGSTRGRVTILK